MSDAPKTCPHCGTPECPQGGHGYTSAGYACPPPDPLEELRKEVEALRSENKYLKEREAHIASLLQVADGGQYRADWKAPIERLVEERKQSEDAQNAAYGERHQIVALLAWTLFAKGMRVGMRPHTGEDWGERWRFVVMMDLPTGQVSWHIPQEWLHLYDGLPRYGGDWDGHTTEEKYRRVQEGIRRVAELQTVFDPWRKFDPWRRGAT